MKSRFISDDYQNFIKDLSSVENSPLGFSFSEVIVQSIQANFEFRRESKFQRFLTSAKTVISSPLVASIPGVSNAAGIANSVLSLASSAIVENKEIDTTKLKDFQTEINRYISYYVAIEDANQLSSVRNSDRLKT
ncbi:MAG: hypothetical protein AAGC88_14295 [Bacteroidota bacterium]